VHSDSDLETVTPVSPDGEGLLKIPLGLLVLGRIPRYQAKPSQFNRHAVEI
jgi:hypothetical protein